MLKRVHLRAVAVSAVLMSVWAAAPSTAGAVTLHVDKDSHSCSDGHSATLASSPTSPWCSLSDAVAAAPAGSTVLVRGSGYERLSIVGQRRASLVTIAPGPGQPATIDSFHVERSSNFRIQGFQVVGSTSSVMLSDHIQVVANDFVSHGLLVRAVKDSLIEGNRIHDLSRTAGKPAPDGYGIWANGYWNGGSEDGIANLVIRGNTFTNIPNDGIQLGGGASRVKNVTIEYNEFSGVRRRVESDHPDPIQVIGGDGIVIRGNYMHDSEVALIVKDGTTYGLRLENNLMVGGEGGGIQAQLWDTPGAVVVNNTIWGSKLGGLRLADESGCCGTTSGIVVRNNIIDKYDEGNPAWIASEDHNLIQSGPRRGPGDLEGAPRFEGLYQLAPGSPGIDAGHGDAPALDRLGRPRTDDPGVPDRGSLVDMGAHERPGLLPASTAPESGATPVLGPPAPTRRARGSSRIRVSRSPQRRRSRPLTGRVVSGRVHVFVRAPKRRRRVSFWLDDIERRRPPRRVDRHAPYDLRGGHRRAKALKTRRLANGRHTLTVAIKRRATGKKRKRSSRRARTRLITVAFTVQN